MTYDVVIVGAGPAGLSAAIRLKQLAAEAGRDVSVCILEKGARVGAHILSGAVLETRALDELLPDWRARGAPVTTPVRSEKLLFLSARRGFAVPHALMPPAMHNHGNYIISLGLLCAWLAEQAEAVGVEIYPGFAADGIVYDGDRVAGVVTGDMGIGRDGNKTANFAPGMELRARYTLFAEGCRGHLGKELMARFGLRDNVDPQTFGLGLKELWRVKSPLQRPGHVVHTAGWPLDRRTYGGGFVYHLDDNQVAVGLVVGLDYRNPHLNPYAEFQKFKTHPAIRPLFDDGERISYGARALNEGGLQSLPKMTFPGGALIGCEAGTLNVAKIKGTHTAMKSGMVAAESVFRALGAVPPPAEPVEYAELFRHSWLHSELHRARNFRPSFDWGLGWGTLAAGIDQFLLRGRAPWTLRHRHGDHTMLLAAAACPPIDYPKPDGTLTFDLMSSVYLTTSAHAEDQPVHLTLKDAAVPITVNLARFDAPEQRYCPAGVYEIVSADDGPRLQINAANCIHCKTCDIKDPTQNIHWVTPEGGAGPNYGNM